MTGDQATGLRRLFAGGRRQRLIPIAANPFVAASGALLEALTAALVVRGMSVLVVDAAASAPSPRELALVDLASCIEPLSDSVSYLAARGLPMAHIDTRGSANRFLDAITEASPQCEVLLLHAEPTELARMLQQRGVRPLLLGADRPEAIKHAYACAKLLAQRCELMTFDLVLAARPGNRRLKPIVTSLGSCIDTFLGGVLHDWAVVDPIGDIDAARDAALQRLLGAQIAFDAEPPYVPARAFAVSTTAARLSI